MDATAKITKMAHELKALRDRKEQLEAELKEVNKKKDRLENNDLPREMEDQEITKVSIENLGTLYLQSSVYAYINVEDREKANDWFKANGYGDIVKESVHHGTLKGWVREQLETGHDVPDFCNAKPTLVARIRSK